MINNVGWQEYIPAFIIGGIIAIVLSILIHGFVNDLPKETFKSPTMEFIEDINKHLIPSYAKEGK